MYEPYQDDGPVMGTSTVEMVVDDTGGGMDIGGDDPDMLSDFGETDSDEDEFLIPPGGRGGGGGGGGGAATASSSSAAAAADRAGLPSTDEGSASAVARAPPSPFSSSSMTCSYCLNVLYVPAMFGM